MAPGIARNRAASLAWARWGRAACSNAPGASRCPRLAMNETSAGRRGALVSHAISSPAEIKDCRRIHARQQRRARAREEELGVVAELTRPGDPRGDGALGRRLLGPVDEENRPIVMHHRRRRREQDRFGLRARQLKRVLPEDGPPVTTPTSTGVACAVRARFHVTSGTPRIEMSSARQSFTDQASIMLGLI